MSSFETFLTTLVTDDPIYQVMFSQEPQLKGALRDAYCSDGQDRWSTYSELKRRISSVVGWNGSHESFRTMRHHKAMIQALDLALPWSEEEAKLRAMSEEAA